MVGGVVTATHWVCGRRRQVDLDLEGEIVQHPGEEEERDEALFNFPLGNNNDEPPPPYVRIKHLHTSYNIYICVQYSVHFFQDQIFLLKFVFVFFYLFKVGPEAGGAGPRDELDDGTSSEEERKDEEGLCWWPVQHGGHL